MRHVHAPHDSAYLLILALSDGATVDFGPSTRGFRQVFDRCRIGGAQSCRVGDLEGHLQDP